MDDEQRKLIRWVRIGVQTFVIFQPAVIGLAFCGGILSGIG